MKSPKDMKIIQIDITNACPHTCSNCTRFCGHHEKTFFMDFADFKQAVDSLEDYEGIVGVIGGEPTLHPEFEKFCDYIREKRLTEKVLAIREPVEDMQTYILNHMWHKNAKAGLWSSLVNSYYKNFEAINDTFKTQLLNDHNNTCMHQALLMPRKELGIGDEEWLKKRDACWIQNTWSATITPKGAFFCEVAGSLDMLFHGPGGWKVEPGWWKREPKDFEDQLHWCEMCSGCLDVPQRISNDKRDDVTPGIYKKLKSINSPKVKRDLCIVHDPKDYDKTKYHTFTGDNDYMELGGNQRHSKENRNLHPKSFVITSWNQLSDTIKTTPKDWILISDNLELCKEAENYFKNVVINPGCLYIYEDVVAIHVKAHALRGKLEHLGTTGENLWGYYPIEKIVEIKRDMRNKIHPAAAAIAEDSKVAVYGAGLRGTEFVSWFLGQERQKQLVVWVDKNYAQKGYPIQEPKSLISATYDILVVVVESKKVFEEICTDLKKLGVNEKTIVWVPNVYEKIECGK